MLFIYFCKLRKTKKNFIIILTVIIKKKKFKGFILIDLTIKSILDPLI